jgi:hypothetical protein
MEIVVHMGEIKNAYLILVGKSLEEDTCEMKYMAMFTFPPPPETCCEEYCLVGYDFRASNLALLEARFLLVSCLVYSAVLKIEAVRSSATSANFYPTSRPRRHNSSYYSSVSTTLPPAVEYHINL